jgi:molybdate transport system substrate-binding protein
MRYLPVAVLLCAACCSKSSPPERKLRVAAAADLAHALGDLGKEFKARTGITVESELAASGLLAKQIEQGAPFALFAAANREFVDQVVKAGKCDGATARSYARGRLVVWTPASVARPASLSELTDARFRKIAIANPDHAPYGRAAKQALEKAGLWLQVEDRIVLGENVQAAMQYARTGNADAAVVALSLAATEAAGASLPVDPSLHAPLDQAMVVCGKAEDADAAKQFEEFILSKEGSEVMSRYGFTLPGEPAPAEPPPAQPPPRSP